MFFVEPGQFTLSKRLYAVNPQSVKASDVSAENSTLFRVELEAAWFRRKRGVTAACIGILWDYQQEKPTCADEFLRRHDDGRFGANCRARWDGESIWTLGISSQMNEDLAILQTMLDKYPAIPNRFVGWYCF